MQKGKSLMNLTSVLLIKSLTILNLMIKHKIVLYKDQIYLLKLKILPFWMNLNSNSQHPQLVLSWKRSTKSLVRLKKSNQLKEEPRPLLRMNSNYLNLPQINPLPMSNKRIKSTPTLSLKKEEIHGERNRKTNRPYNSIPAQLTLNRMSRTWWTRLNLYLERNSKKKRRPFAN